MQTPPEHDTTASRRTGIIGALAVLIASVSIGVSLLIPRFAEPGPILGDEPTIRVRVARSAETLKIDAQRWVLASSAGDDLTALAAPVLASVQDGGIVLTGPEGVGAAFPPGATVRVRCSWLEDLRVGDAMLPGSLWLSPVAREGGAGAINAIVRVPIETYIAGVIAAELYSHWPEDTFGVQAVAARSFAMAQMERRRSRAFDVENTQMDQVFRGRATSERALAAASATRGFVLTHGGGVMHAYYSSTCGGRPAGAAETWPGRDDRTPPPLRARERAHFCDHSPVYRWEVERETGIVREQLRHWARGRNDPLRDLGRPVSIEPSLINAAGRPAQFTVTDDRGGSYTITAENLRIALNAQPPGLRVGPGSVRSGDLGVVIRGDRTVIAGRGFGHGVGMCQFCAEAMAREGHSWREMLGHFYPGARLERVFR